MISQLFTDTGVVVVLADANVLYSRVLRDYLLYAADQEVISITWSATILREVTRNLAEKRPGFSVESGERLVAAMNDAFPLAEFEPEGDAYARLDDESLPDEGDRHVIAAALAAEAHVLCTANTRDFPFAVMDRLSVLVATPDELLKAMIESRPGAMLAVHAITVEGLAHATDASTLDALRRAGAAGSADAMSHLLSTQQ